MRVGLVVNPIAGMGGSVGLAGTDGEQRLEQAILLGAKPRAGQRCTEFLEPLIALLKTQQVTLLAAEGEAGSHWCDKAGIAAQKVVPPAADAKPTQSAVQALVEKGIDLLVFVGGDGTARDVLAALPETVCALGVPAGVKMHSGVFAVTPAAAARVLANLLEGDLVALHPREVRDFPAVDGEPDRQQVVTFGELLVPDQGSYMQHTKVGGVESEPLVVEEIAAYMAEQLADAQVLVLGPGSTLQAIKAKFGVQGSLRGFDVLVNGQVQRNVTETQLLEVLRRAENPNVVLSFTRQQGFLLGRGNQQLSAQCLALLRWPQQITVVGSRTKLSSLQGRPLMIDTADKQLDALLSGVIPIIAGYDDQLLYRVACDYEAM